MSESQFEKMLRALKDAERQVEVQDETINDLRAENKQLRERSWEISEDKRQIDMRRIEAEHALLYERHEVQRLRDEIGLMRKLIKGVVGNVVQATDWENLLDEIKKEVGDECDKQRLQGLQDKI